MQTDFQEIIQFWFEETEPKNWFVKNQDFDKQLHKRFFRLHQAVAQGEYAYWRDQAAGRLAEIIVLDQFSRNLFRDSAQAFAYDAQALVLAQEAIRCGDDKKLSFQQQAFLYMPFMHSESLPIHEQAVALFGQEGMEKNYEFELKHKRIIEQFGRYPHRNEVLGRESTSKEIKFLQQPGSSF